MELIGLEGKPVVNSPKDMRKIPLNDGKFHWMMENSTGWWKIPLNDGKLPVLVYRYSIYCNCSCVTEDVVNYDNSEVLLGAIIHRPDAPKIINQFLRYWSSQLLSNFGTEIRSDRYQQWGHASSYRGVSNKQYLIGLETDRQTGQSTVSVVLLYW